MMKILKSKKIINSFIVSFVTLMTMLSCSNNKHHYDIELPVFVDIFLAGQEDITGFNDEQYVQFREQNVVVTNSGAIVVVVQGRNASDWSDRSGQDLWSKISYDDGLTWTDPILMDEQGEKSIVPNATVYDEITDRILTLYNVVQWPFTDSESRHAWEGPKYKQYVIYSDDDGKTWSEPQDISYAAKDDSLIQIFGSGEGIQLKKGSNEGSLIVPGGDFLEPNKRVFAWISDDHGDTWTTSEPVPNPHDRITPVENAIVELSDGRLLMNERMHDPGHRWQSISDDAGETWSPFEPVKDLPSVSCNAGIIRVNHNGKDILLYAGPIGPNPYAEEGTYNLEYPWAERRVNGTIFASDNSGETWSFRQLLVPDYFAYSSLVELADGDIGLFYESNNHRDIRMLKVSLDWLFNCDI